MHLDQHLVMFWNRFLYLLELKNIGRTVSGAHNCFHELAPDLPAEATDERADALNPLAMSHTARTISCTPNGISSTFVIVDEAPKRPAILKTPPAR
jgi:hypothetical protein